MHIALVEFSTSLVSYSIQLANALGKLCQVTLMLPDASGDLVDLVDQQKVNLKLFRKPRMRQLINLNMIRGLRRQIQDMHPDVVHSTSWDIWGTPGLGMCFPIPTVVTVHDVERHPGEHGLWAIPSAVYPWQWRWAKQIIVHATNSRQQLLNKYGCQADRVHVIPIGAYSFYTHWAVNNQPEKTNTLLFFGRIWGYKGLQYLIDAEPLISQAVPDVHIIIAGQGEPIEKYWRSMVNPDRFEIHDRFIPNDEVAAFFQQASLIILPYIEASQSAVVAIAYAFGKPIVATRVGGLPDVVQDGQTGLLVPPADARSLAQAIIRLLKDSGLRQQMGRNAKQFSEGELSWDKVAEKTLKVYQQVLAKSE
jgi:glycosyltransferase involved in cell wall biosynthesis